MELKNNTIFNLSFSHPVLLYDGNCILCSHVIQWVIRYDKKAIFRFSQLQKKSIQTFLNSSQIDEDSDSVILINEGKLYFKSDAAFRVLDCIGGYWKVLKALMIFPRFVRDKIYDIVARNRYKWFGKKENCLVPTQELMHRFV